MSGEGELLLRRARVTGRVQGVFFRASAAERARALGLRGYARNLPDGSVEVLMAGSAAGIEAMRQWLAHGPPMARVDAVEIDEPAAGSVELPEGFLAG